MLKLSCNFILRTVAGEHIVIPVGEAALQIKGLICLSESGKLLFEKLKGGCTREDLLELLLENYEIADPGEAAADVDHFLFQMDQLKMLDPSLEDQNIMLEEGSRSL